MTPAVAEAIRRSAAVPSIPQVVARFLEVIQDPEFEYDDVVRVLSTDPGTVSEILRIANSALFRAARTLTSFKQAVIRLGPRRTRSLVLGRYLVEAMEHTAAGALVDSGYFWRRSLTSALIAAQLTAAFWPSLRDDAFLGGLLADIGVPILAQARPAGYARFVGRYVPNGTSFSEDEERAAVEASHAEVSAFVLEEWTLPETMRRAVLLSHTDSVPVVDDATQLARAVNSADCIAKLLTEISDADACVAISTRAMQFVGAELSDMVSIMDKLEGDLTEFASILKIEVTPPSAYAHVRNSIDVRLVTAAASE